MDVSWGVGDGVVSEWGVGVFTAEVFFAAVFADFAVVVAVEFGDFILF